MLDNLLNGKYYCFCFLTISFIFLSFFPFFHFFILNLFFLDRIILTPLDIRNSFISSLRRFLQVVNWHLGDIKTAVELYKDDLFPTLSYSKVLIEREEWNKYRERIKSNLIPNFQKHFVTYANYYNPGLHNLLYSARLADVELKVIQNNYIIFIHFFIHFFIYCNT